tara:strand:+ start:3452 stop:4144 length:693 start_codon:yes stop_codon:yes gene_type:complete
LKNILARGGIEFLAVLLGLSGSLWIDGVSKNNAQRKEFFQDLIAINNELIDDLNVVSEKIEYNEKKLKEIREFLTIFEKSKIGEEALDTLAFFKEPLGNRSFFGKKSAYLSSKSAGNFNRTSNLNIVHTLTRLYDQTYVRMDANNKYMDDITLRDDQWTWYLSNSTRNFIYNIDEVLNKINSSEFYNWVIKNEFMFNYFIDLMKETKKEMIETQKQLSNELETKIKNKDE